MRRRWFSILGRSPAPAGEGAPPTGSALGWSFRTSLLVQGINTVTGILLARGLGVTDRGQLAAAMLWPLVLGAIATLGLEESATYHVARSPASAGRVLGAGLMLCAVQSLVFTVACAALVPIVLASHGHAVIVSAFLYLAFIPLNAVGVLLAGILNGLHRYQAYNWVRLAVGLFTLIAQVVLLATHALSVRTMVIGYDVCYAATAVVAAWLVHRARAGRVQRDRAVLRSVFGYGIRSHASTTSAQLNQRLDLLVITIFLSARQLGLYVVAVSLSSLSALVGGSVARVALPSVARLAEGPRRTLLARRLLSLTLVVSAVLAVPVVVLASPLLRLFFGAGFQAATDVTRVLILAAIAYSMSRSIESVLRAVGRPLDAGIAEFIALGATFAGLAVLVPTAGLLGAGLASLLAYSIACAWMLRRAAKALDVRWVTLLLPDRDAVRWFGARALRLADRRTGGT